MNKMVKSLLIIVVVAGIAVMAAFKLMSNKKEVETKVYRPDPDFSAAVQADTVKQGPFSEATQFLGSFTANREVAIASETSGKVIDVGVEEGRTVGQGNLVARLDDGVLVAELHSATASLDNATGTLQRYQQAPNGVTQLQMDNARTQVETGQAQVEQLKKQIGQYTIYAPFAGVITARNFDLGAVVSPGAALATLTDLSSVKLEISVPEQYVAQFKKDMPLSVVTDVYPGTVFKGSVWMIASKADASHNYAIKVLVPNSAAHPLKVGMYGNVTVGDVSSRPAISIPRSALIGSAQKPQVYVVDGGVARIRGIETGAGNAKYVEVVKGLSEGEVVVSGGLVNLADNTKVTIK
jgi:RND family efflux transporter MFP subunit